MLSKLEPAPCSRAKPESKAAKLNPVLVRFGDSDEHTDEVIEALHDSGDAFASGATWRGQRALRGSVCNWQTTKADRLALTDTLITAHRALSRAPAPQTFG